MIGISTAERAERAERDGCGGPSSSSSRIGSAPVGRSASTPPSAAPSAGQKVEIDTERKIAASEEVARRAHDTTAIVLVGAKLATALILAAALTG